MKKFKVIIDTDPGIDDSTALFFALTEPKLDIKLFCTSGGNVTLEHSTRNVCHILDLLEKNIPVAKGYSKRFGNSEEFAYHMHGTEGMGNYIPPKTTKTKPIKGDCADAIYEVLKKYPNEITYFEFGPHTNLANLLKKYPDSKKLIKQIIMMGGAPGGIKINPNYASFNIRTDVEAFEKTINSGITTTLCPSRVGREITHFTEEQVEFVKNSSLIGRFFAMTYETYWEPGYDEKILSCCDLTALFYLLYPKFFKTENAFLTLDTQEHPGKLTANYSRKGNFKIIRDVNRKKFQKIVFKKLEDFKKIQITNKTFLKNLKEAD